jgi:hypothetical protein
LICPFCVQLTVAFIALLLGALIAWKPEKVIKIQIAFYRTINWKMEPISMAKEIANTRIMGLALAILAVLAMVYILTRSS